MRLNLKDDPNGKYIQWHSLDYMANEMLMEVMRRANEEPYVMWAEWDTLRLMRAMNRITRVLNEVECPEFQ